MIWLVQPQQNGTFKVINGVTSQPFSNRAFKNQQTAQEFANELNRRKLFDEQFDTSTIETRPEPA